jgi:imidazolonepropionase-like amidohydrolase
MRRRIAALLLLLPWSSVAWADDPWLALVGGRVLPAPDAIPLADGTILIHRGKIAAVGPRRDVSLPAGAQVIDCGGRVIAAGFWNSHVHFSEAKWRGAARQPADALEEHLRVMFTRHGFVSVVDTGSLPDDTLAIRRRIEAGEVLGPAIRTAGGPLYPQDGIPFYLRESLPPDILPLLAQPATPQKAVEVVRANVALGTDIVKLFTGSWVERGQVKPMSSSVARAAVEEAHRKGRLVFSHASNVRGLEVALASGVDVLAHALDDTRGLTAAHLDRARRFRMALIPTLKLFSSGGRAPPDIIRQVGDFARRGGEILFGTDVGYLADDDPSDEYVLLARAGLGWNQILAALTTTPAARFRVAARSGRIAVGMDADLVVLEGDPQRDVRAFARARYTLRAGRIIHDSLTPGRRP